MRLRTPTMRPIRRRSARWRSVSGDNGWELASHSWGHINFGKRSFEDVKTDSDKWASHESLIGKTDILLYPFGSDVGDWHPYTSENEKYEYLHQLGFRYFCNVDSSQYWVQFGPDYLRQDAGIWMATGCTMISPETNPTKDHLERSLRCVGSVRPRTASSGGTDELTGKNGLQGVDSFLLQIESKSPFEYISEESNFLSVKFFSFSELHDLLDLLRRFNALGVENRSDTVVVRPELVCDLRTDLDPLLCLKVSRLTRLADKS